MIDEKTKEFAEIIKDIILRYQQDKKSINQLELGILTKLSYGASLNDLWGDFYKLKEAQK